jgi:hypothetical protein
MVVTRADVYDKILSAERPVCPHCGQEMNIWECFNTPFTCGSRWGSPYLYVCANDQCPAFVQGWASMKRQYGKTCSYRCICYPDSRKTALMMVFTHNDTKAGIIEEDVIARDKVRGTNQDPAVQELLRSFESRTADELMASLTNKEVYHKVRAKAAELIGELGLLETIEPLSNFRPKDPRVSVAIRKAITRIHAINATQECPYCKEIIEGQAATCSQCGRDLPQTKG